jgi:hypothetical protein
MAAALRLMAKDAVFLVPGKLPMKGLSVRMVPLSGAAPPVRN